MGDVIELSSDEEEIRGVKRKSQEMITTVEDEEEEEKIKRLRLSPFKDDILVLDDEDQEPETVTEKDLNVSNILDSGKAEEITKAESNKSLCSESTEILDLTNGVNSEEEKEDNPSGNVDNNEEEMSTVEKTEEVVVEIDEKTIKFIDKCIECISSNKLKTLFKQKVPIFEKVYVRASQFVVSKDYDDLITDTLEKLENNSEKAVVYFDRVYKTLQSNCNSATTSGRLRRLEDMLIKLSKKLKALEEAEVDFDDEENSSYLQLQRYRERAYKVYTAIKKIEKDDPNKGRAYYGRVDFAHSSYPDINRALSKKYQNRDKRPFPTFDGVDKCIRKTVETYNLDISEGKLKLEIRSCFEALGDLLQRKRKIDLATVHLEYLGEVVEDPAQKDAELNKKLQENSRIYRGKMQTVLDKFEVMQSEGVSVELSEDSDNSNEPNSDDDSD